MSDSASYLDTLNPQQRAAVEYLGGPELVIAGAGSGKTRVVTYKIVHLLNMGIAPWRIIALTFTNKAAREMRERVEAVTDAETASRLWMGTFHSIFSRILRRHAELLGYKSTFTIYDTADSRNLIKSIVRDLRLDEKVYKPATVLNEISNAKNALVTPEMYAADSQAIKADRDHGRGLIYRCYALYAERCRLAGAMDFDDLLMNTHRLFTDHPDVLEEYRKQFMYMLVDEYQDTNPAQHRIVEALVREHGALCVVGDDAQSIYSFRGANIRNILNLKDDFPNLATFRLERNYRSTRNITDAASSLIAHNRDQLPKQVYSENEPGDKLEVVRCYSDNEEGYKVVGRLIARRSTTGDPFNEFAILYRTNAQSRVLEEALRSRNIPYRIYGGMSFYQRKEVKDALAYFRLAVNPDDDEALKRVINYPARGIGETTVNRLQHAAISQNMSIWQVIDDPSAIPPEVKGAARKKLADFATLIDGFVERNRKGESADLLARSILLETGMAAMFDHDHTPENISKKENLNELLNGVITYVAAAREQGEEDLSMTSFLNTVSLATDQDSDDTGETDRVTLMTVHAAKGLEFNNVFIVGVEDGLFPSSMASDTKAEIEEERRLLYVAITRARKFCSLSYARSRFRNGTTIFTNISPFLKEIDRRFVADANIYTTDDSPRRSSGSFSRSLNASATSLDRVRSYMNERPAPRAAGKQEVTGDMTKHTADELSPGMTIVHYLFGEGTILEVSAAGAAGPSAKVRFKDSGNVSNLLLKYAKFKIL